MAGRKHKIEVYTDGDPMSWKVSVFDAKKAPGRAEKLGIRTLPTIVVDGKLMELKLVVSEENMN